MWVFIFHYKFITSFTVKLTFTVYNIVYLFIILMLDLLEKIYIYIYIYIWVMINEFLVCVFSFLGQSDMEETVFF